MKRWIRLGTIVVVIAAMVVAIIVLRSQEDQPAEPPEVAETTVEEEPQRIPLFDNPRDEIASIRIETQDTDLTVVRTDENTFTPVYEYDVAFNEQRVNRIVSQAAVLTSRRVIGEVDDPAEYGLDDPAATVTVERTDGDEQRVVIGSQTPGRNAYYVTQDGDDTVYTVYNSWIAAFLTTLDSLRVRSIPQITFEKLQRVRIGTLDGRTITAEQLPEWDTDPELGFSRFVVTEPFERRFQVNTNWLEELSTSLESLRIGRYVDDAPADLADYGLASPEAGISIADEQNTLELLIGTKTEGGRFATFAETPSVFVLSGAEQIISVRPYDTISAFALIINIDLVDRFVVEGPEATYTGRIERSPVEGEEEPEATYFINDQQIEEDLFKDLYQWAIGMQFDAEIPLGERAAPQREPLATITYHLNNDMGPLRVSFVPRNENFSAVVREGDAEFLIATAKVQRMLTAFEEAAAAL